MATKDYVKRPRAANKKQAQKRKMQKQERPNWLKIVLALSVVGIFAYGLYQLQTSNTEDADIKQNSTQTDSIKKSLTDESSQPSTIINVQEELEKVDQSPLPELQDEEWDYIDSLPEFSVEVDATGPKLSKREFTMQCGSFKKSELAEKLRAQIALQGLESRTIQKGLWYAVVLGPYERKREAERHRHQLRSANINGCRIW